MGADVCYLYFGIVRKIPLSSPEITELETQEHSIFSLGLEHKLDVTWGVPYEDQDAFLLIGTEIGVFGAENSMEVSRTSQELEDIIQKTREKLLAAGITEEPKLHCQFEVDY